MGIPPGNGLIPQAPLHVRALCKREHVVDSHGVKHDIVTHVEEQRWSGLGQATLMFVALSLFRVLSWIPRRALYGLFFYLGVDSLYGNEVWQRFTLCFMVAKTRPAIPVVREVRWRTVQYFTLIQALCAFVIFAISEFTSIGYIFPALLALLIPFRSYVLVHVFDKQDFIHLDPSGETDEDYHDEQRAIHEAERRGSFDSEDVNFPNRAEFRTEGMRRALLEHRHEIERNSVIVHDEERAESQQPKEVVLTD